MLTLIIKPSHKCNLKCSYCYDACHRIDQTTMSLETVENIFKVARTFEDRVEVIWHGGEPLLLDLETFYRPIYETIIPKYFDLKKVKSNMQSNGTIFNPMMIAFMEKYHIQMGASYDGILNDLTRKNTKLLKENRLKAKMCGVKGWDGFLMVVTPNNVHTVLESYKESEREGFTLNFSEMFCDQSEEQAIKDLKDIVKAYRELFEYIVEKPNAYIPRPLNLYISAVLDSRRVSMCETIHCVGKWLGIHPDGSVYPCGRTWRETYKLGNINQVEHIDELFANAKALKEHAHFINTSCATCPIKHYCNGGCPNTTDLIYKELGHVNLSHCIFSKTMYEMILDVLKSKTVKNKSIQKEIMDSPYVSVKKIPNRLLKEE